MMMFKRGLVAIVSMLALGQAAHAQYMSMGDMPMTDAYKGKVLKNAISSGNFTLVDNWVKENGGYTIPYDNKNVCASEITNVRQFDPLSAKVTPEKQATYLGVDGLNIYFTECDLVPIPSLLEHITSRYTPTTVKYFPERYPSASDTQQVEKNKVKIKYALDFMNALQPNQWEVLIPIIKNPEMEFEVRKQALTLLNKFYPTRMETATEPQKRYWKEIEKLEKSNAEYSAKHAHYDRSTAPYNYLVKHLVKNIAYSTEKLADAYAFSTTDKEQVSDVLTKDYFLGKTTVTPEQLVKLNLGSGKFLNQDAMQVWQETELLKVVLANSNTKLDYQDTLGNSVLHNTLINHWRVFSNNKVLANLYRSFLERGVNPNLLNNESKTAYMIFQQDYNGDEGRKFLFEAFALKNYK